MTELSGDDRLGTWRAWLLANTSAPAAAAQAGAEAAVAAGDRGLGRLAAVASACLAMEVPYPPQLRAALPSEQQGVEDFLDSLSRFEPGNGLTARGLQQLRRLMEARLEEYRRLAGAPSAPSVLASPASADAGPALPAPTTLSAAPSVGGLAHRGAAAAPRPERGPAFSMQGFLSEHGILVLSYVGAFLLIVATLLFEVYGTTGADGVTRFAAVLLLTVFFAGAGRVGLTSQRLRLVGRSYVAVAALLTPLDFAAAYNFLVLNQYGVTAATAVALAGGSCAVLYGVIAARLRSQGYAHLALVALAVGWGGTLEVVHAGRWAGAGFAALCLVYAVLAAHPGPLRSVASLWRAYSQWYLHAAALIAVGWTLATIGNLDLVPAMRYVAAALGVVAVGYLARGQLSGSIGGATAGVATAFAAWAATVVALGITDWAGAAVAPTALVVVGLRRLGPRSRFGTAFAPTAGVMLNVTAGVAALWTAALFTQAGAHSGATFAALAFAVLAVAYLLDARVRPDIVTAGIGQAAAGLAYLAILYQPEIGAWRGAAFLPMVGLFAMVAASPAIAGRLGRSLQPTAEILTHVGALVAVVLAAGGAEEWPMTVVLAGLTLVYAVQAALPSRRWLVWIPAIGVSATVLQGAFTLALQPAVVALELAALAWGYLLASDLGGRRDVKLAFFAGAVLQALAIALLPVTPDALFTGLLVGGAGVGAAVAARERQPLWLSASAPLLTLGWYHLAGAVLPRPASPGPDDLVRVFMPLPLLYAAAAVALRQRFGRSWMRPPAGSAAVVAAGVLYGAGVAADYVVLGWSLLLYSLAVYLFAVLERSAVIAAVAAALLGGAVVTLLHSANAAPWTFPVAVVLVSAGVHQLQVAWRHAGRVDQDWQLVHRAAGLGGAALGVVGAFSGFVDPSRSQALAGLAATLGLAALLYFDARLHSSALLEYGGGLVAALGFFWLDRLAAVTNPQLYFAPIGLAVIALGVTAGRDRRLTVDRWLIQVATGAGLLMLLGTTALQSFSEAVPWSYTALLVGEAAVALVVGVGLRNRTVVLGASAAVAVASLRALVLLQQEYPLYVVFGAVALVLLVVAGGLSMMRDSLATARTSVGRSWQEWD